MERIKENGWNVNLLAVRSWAAAVRRGQVGDNTRHEDRVRAIRGELREFERATVEASEHLPGFTEQQEELADIILVCLTSLCELKTDVGDMLDQKIKFNNVR